MPYDPFWNDLRPRHRIECSWREILEYDAIMFERLYKRFRSEFDSVPDIPDDLCWGFQWTENGFPLDLSLTDEDRADLRIQAVRTIACFCEMGGHLLFAKPVANPPDVVCAAIFEEEAGRMNGHMNTNSRHTVRQTP